MTRYAITGPRELTVEQERIVADAVLLYLQANARPNDEFTSGASFGADTIAANVAAEFTIITILRLTIPNAPHNYALQRKAREEGWLVEFAPLATSPSKAYLQRDDLTVSHTDILLAFPRTSREQRRSGTWATIRRARKAGCEIHFFPLDGSTPWVEDEAARLFP